MISDLSLQLNPFSQPLDPKQSSHLLVSTRLTHSSPTSSSCVSLNAPVLLTSQPFPCPLLKTLHNSVPFAQVRNLPSLCSLHLYMLLPLPELPSSFLPLAHSHSSFITQSRSNILGNVVSFCLDRERCFRVRGSSLGFPRCLENPHIPSSLRPFLIIRTLIWAGNYLMVEMGSDL